MLQSRSVIDYLEDRNMQDFIVLGLVPGTSIQIGFEGWIFLSEITLIIFCLFSIWRHHMLKSLTRAMHQSRVESVTDHKAGAPAEYISARR